jgi:tight adherence protein B
MWLFGSVLAGLIFGLMGLALPKLLLWWLKKKRDEKFDRQLVEALTNLGNSLQAGFSLNQGLELLAREMDNPMGQEIGMVVREIQVGVEMEDALEHLYQRMPSKDLDLIISSILISRDVGGDLTEIFDNIAHTIRDRHRIEGKIKALSAQGKLQGFVILCIPPGMAIALSYIAPKMIEPLFTTPVGWLLMALVVVLMGMGIYTIYRIVAIEV